MLNRANSLIANNNIRSVILEIKTTDVKSLIRSLSRKYFQSKCSRKENKILDFTSVAFISNLTLLILLFAIKNIELFQ